MGVMQRCATLSVGEGLELGWRCEKVVNSKGGRFRVSESEAGYHARSRKSLVNAMTIRKVDFYSSLSRVWAEAQPVASR